MLLGRKSGGGIYSVEVVVDGTRGRACFACVSGLRMCKMSEARTMKKTEEVMIAFARFQRLIWKVADGTFLRSDEEFWFGSG